MAFPEEYFTSLTRIYSCKQLILYDEMLDKITDCPTAAESNQAILDLAIALRGSDLIEFCSIMETVIEDKQKISRVVEPLRNGLYLNIRIQRSPKLAHYCAKNELII